MNLLYGNFDFEHQLGRAQPRTLPASLQRMNAELAYSLIAIAQPGDLLWAAEPADSGYAKHLAAIGLPAVRFVQNASQVPESINLVPWGWSPAVKEWGSKHGWRCECPDLAAVARANSREFSASLEREWNVGLPNAQPVSTLAEFEAAVNALPSEFPKWVAKANFGMSARERVLGPGPDVSSNNLQWLQKRLAEGPVYFEPWVERIEEVAFQFTIPATGEPILEGITTLLTDALGTYRGSRLSGESCQYVTADEIADVLPIVNRAARSVQQLGYFGPLGIDAMLYAAPDGRRLWRPLQDINARWTMGRVALGFRRIVPHSPHATWLRCTGVNTAIEERIGRNANRPTQGTKIIRTSPLQQPSAAGMSFLLTADTRQALFTAEQICLSG
jgi:hypothetical protein